MFTEIAVAAGLPSGRELSLSAPVRDPGAALLCSLRCWRFPLPAPVPVQVEAEGVPWERAAAVPSQGSALSGGTFLVALASPGGNEKKEGDFEASLPGKSMSQRRRG